MGTPLLRVRLMFEDRSILTKTQRSDGMNNTWLLLKLQQHPTISDVCTHLLHIFKLNRSCPNGILLSMEGFTLPPFESTEILKDKEIICVKKKGATSTVTGNLLDEVEDDGLLLLEKDNLEYQSEFEEVDEEHSEDEVLPEEAVSKKRKASANLHNLKNKKRCLGVLVDDEDESESEEIEDVNNDALHHMKISSKKKNDIKAATTNKKTKSPSIVKRSEELQENVEEVNHISDTPGPKKISRSSRRKKAQRKRKRELPEHAKIVKKKTQAYSKRQVTKHKNEEANDQPKGLLYWKQDSKKFDVGPVVNRPGHIRFDSPERDQVAKQTGVSNGSFKRNGSSSSKKKGQKWFRENLKKNECRRLNKESFKMLFKDSKVPVIDINEFDKLPPCSEPKEGDVIAYRLLELNSSWIPEYSSFRVGRISYYDAKDIDLIPVPEYPLVLEKLDDNKPNDSLYGEDGTLEINYSALVDVRNIMQHDPVAMNNGVSQTPLTKNAAENLMSNISDTNMDDVIKDNNLEDVEMDPWVRFSSKKTEMPEPNGPNHSGLNPCSYVDAGPSSSTGPDEYKAESSGVKELKEGQMGNSLQENNDSSPDVQKTVPTENDCENVGSWGRPWSAFVVSRGSSVIKQDKENESCRGSGKLWSRGAQRGRGRGRGYGRGRNG